MLHLGAVCSNGFSLPIETNCLSQYFYRVEVDFENTLYNSNIELQIILNVFEKIEERLTGSIKAGSWLQYAHMALVCP